MECSGSMKGTEWKEKERNKKKHPCLAVPCKRDLGYFPGTCDSFWPNSKVLHGYFIMEERNDDLWIFFMPLVRFSRAPIPKSRGQSSSWRRRTKDHSFTLHYLHFSVPLKIRKWIKTNHDKRMWVSEVKHELFLFPLYFVIFEYK